MSRCTLPFSCRYTTSSRELSLFSRTSWLIPGPCAVPLTLGLFPSTGDSGPVARTVRVLHLAQKVTNPATASTFSTSKSLHLLNTKAIKKSPASELRSVRRGGREDGSSLGGGSRAVFAGAPEVQFSSRVQSAEPHRWCRNPLRSNRSHSLSGSRSLRAWHREVILGGVSFRGEWILTVHRSPSLPLRSPDSSAHRGREVNKEPGICCASRTDSLLNN